MGIKVLQDRFGNSCRIAQAWNDKVMGFKVIKDLEQLQDFSDLYDLKEKWLKVNHNIVSRSETLTFNSVVNFLRLETEVLSDPIFGVLVKLTSRKKESKFKHMYCLIISVTKSSKPINSHSQFCIKFSASYFSN